MFPEKVVIKEMIFEIESRVKYMESLEEKKKLI